MSLMMDWKTLSFRLFLLQSLLALFVLIAGWFFFENLSANLNARGLTFSFSFLKDSAGFDIAGSLVDYKLGDSYLWVYLIAVLNTLILGLLGIVGCSIIGVIFGIGSVSSNYLMRQLSRVYVEVFRNIPLLLQIFFWYFLLLSTAPSVKQSQYILGAFFNKKGLFLPVLQWSEGVSIFVWGVLFILVVSGVFRYLFPRYFSMIGWLRAGLFFGIILIVWLLIFYTYIGSPVVLSSPVIQGFGVAHALNIGPEFIALFLGLSLYTGAFVAEVVRGGIQSVKIGQKEAAQSLGLGRFYAMRFVIFPQVLLVILPPLVSQYLNLMKNTSLAAFVGYPDIMSLFGGVVLSQSGRSIEVMLITIASYLSINLVISVLINQYNARRLKYIKPS